MKKAGSIVYSKIKSSNWLNQGFVLPMVMKIPSASIIEGSMLGFLYPWLKRQI